MLARIDVRLHQRHAPFRSSGSRRRAAAAGSCRYAAARVDLVGLRIEAQRDRRSRPTPRRGGRPADRIAGLDGMGLGQVGVERERPFGRRQAVVARAARGRSAAASARGPSAPRRAHSPGSISVARRHRRMIASARADVALVAGDVVLPRHQVEVVGLDVVGAALLDRLLLLRQQLQLQRLDDRLRRSRPAARRCRSGRGRSARPRRGRRSRRRSAAR